MSTAISPLRRLERLANRTADRLVPSSAKTIIIVLVLATALFVAEQWPNFADWRALSGINVVVSSLLVLTGLLLWRDPGQRGVAWALIITGVMRSTAYVDSWDVTPFPVIGLVFGGFDRVFGAWALLRYPNAALTRPHRAFLIGLASWMLTGRVLTAVTSTAQWAYGEPTWWPTLLPDLRLSEVISAVDFLGEGMLGLFLVVLLVRRLVQARPLDKVVLTPVMVAGIAATIAAIASAVAQQVVGLVNAPVDVYFAENAVDLTLPLAFLVAVTQRALLSRNISLLIRQIHAGAGIDVVRDALRSALHDPSLDVIDLSVPSAELPVQPVPDARDGAGLGGTAASGPPAITTLAESADAPGRLVEFIHSEDGKPIAVVIADPTLARFRGLFDAAVQTSSMALKTAQLQTAAAQAKLAEVHASRARIIEAARVERQRIERDLHDGVQQHILGLSARLSAAMAGTTDPAATAAFDGARVSLMAILAELRDLAHGIHPEILSQDGLAAAIDEAAERLSLPARIDIPSTRTRADVESAAYFAACEALTNIVKHASASDVSVHVQMEDGQLRMEIADNGVGGAVSDGHGLANIADRVGALDGSLHVESPVGGGTRLVVTIPCA